VLNAEAPASKTVAMAMKANLKKKMLAAISRSLQKGISRDILFEYAALGLLPRPSEYGMGGRGDRYIKNSTE
jgi:hypothetical protein